MDSIPAVTQEPRRRVKVAFPTTGVSWEGILHGFTQDTDDEGRLYAAALVEDEHGMINVIWAGLITMLPPTAELPIGSAIVLREARNLIKELAEPMVEADARFKARSFLTDLDSYLRKIDPKGGA